MHCLIVAATEKEIRPTIEQMDKTGLFTRHCHQYRYGHLDVDVLITGAGIAAMAYHMGRQLGERRYDLAINAGIAGALNPNFLPGAVVLVTQECFPDLGAEDDGDIITIFDLGLANRDILPYGGGVLKPPPVQGSFPGLAMLLAGLPHTAGLTSDTITGSRQTLQRMQRYADAGVETMEGASFFFGCISEDIPCLQLRAISNMAGERNRAFWKIGTAIEQLNGTLLQILDKL